MNKKDQTKKTLISGNVIKVLYWGSITSLILILFASMQHVQELYLSVEKEIMQKDDVVAYAPWAQAVGMEITLVIAALILALKRRKKEKPEKIYTFGIWAVTFLNFAGNIYAAMIAHGDTGLVHEILKDDRFHLFKMFLASGTIPLFALMLMEYISFFYVLRKQEEIADKVLDDRIRKKEESKALKEQRLAYRENSNLKSIQAELEASKLELSRVKSETKKPAQQPQNRLDNVKVKPKIDNLKKKTVEKLYDDVPDNIGKSNNEAMGEVVIEDHQASSVDEKKKANQY